MKQQSVKNKKNIFSVYQNNKSNFHKTISNSNMSAEQETIEQHDEEVEKLQNDAGDTENEPEQDSQQDSEQEDAPAPMEQDAESAKKPKTKRETRTVGDMYEWQTPDDLLAAFAPTFTGEQFEEIKQRSLQAAEEHQVSLEDVLLLPANVMNQREVEKFRQIIVKYEALRATGEAALRNLLASAQVNKTQREARRLKAALAAERKERKAASSAAAKK